MINGMSITTGTTSMTARSSEGSFNAELPAAVNQAVQKLVTPEASRGNRNDIRQASHLMDSMAQRNGSPLSFEINDLGLRINENGKPVMAIAFNDDGFQSLKTFDDNGAPNVVVNHDSAGRLGQEIGRMVSDIAGIQFDKGENPREMVGFIVENTMSETRAKPVPAPKLG